MTAPLLEKMQCCWFEQRKKKFVYRTFLFLFFFFFLLFCFLGPHPRHTEVPRLGVESELQLPIYTTATAMLDPQPTERGQGSNEPTSSGILVRFVSAAPQQERHTCFYSYRNFIVLKPGRHQGLLILHLKCITIIILIICLPCPFQITNNPKVTLHLQKWTQ